MRYRATVLSAVGAIAAGFLVAGRLASQGGADGEKQKKEMDAFAAYSTPGKEHQLLAKRAGKWDYKAKFYMAPGTPPSESKGKADFKMIFDGRYLQDDTDGEGMPEFGGQPFKGLGITGYDNFKKKFVSTWIDNMGTGILMFEGSASKDGKVLTYHGEEPDLMDPSGKKTSKVRSVDTMIDADHFTFEMFGPGPDGKEYKKFELDYTRRK